MSAAQFTPQQEDRLRKIVREEVRLHRGLSLTAGKEGSEAILPLARNGEGLIVHTPLAGTPRKLKGFTPTSPSTQQDRA